MAQRKRDWRSWKVGDKIRCYSNDPLDHFDCTGIVTKKENDHLIVTVGKDTNLWVDNDTVDVFEKV